LTKNENEVASSLDTELDLRSNTLSLEEECEPEQFPGLVCRLDDPKVVPVPFGSGNLVCTEAKRPNDVDKAVEKISTELRTASSLK
jgi:transcription initiation factor TFIID TATA-box-binding protein